MSETGDFLKRWSQRKREAAERKSEKVQAQDEATPAAAMPVASEDVEGAAAIAKSPAEPGKEGRGGSPLPFDLSKLPSIESIGPTTDIRIFMQPGVPASLTRAALRRAWSADPAIRDYIGLSENSWDFTNPEAIPGFSPLAPADAKKLLADFLNSGPTESSAEDLLQSTQTPPASPAAPPQDDATSASIDNNGENSDAERPETVPENLPETEFMPHRNIAAQAQRDGLQENPENTALASPRPSHGGALPR